MAYGDLCQLGDVKAWLSLGQNPLPNADDALLSRLITAASRFIGSWLGRQVWPPAVWQEVRDGSGGNTLVFANFPVTAVSSLTIDGLAIPAAPAGGGFDAGYRFTETVLSLTGYRFTRRQQNVIVTYTAGYAAVPDDISQACIELVALRYRERTRIGEVSKALAGGETVTFSQKDMSDSTRTLLMPYKAVAPVSGFGRRLAPAGAPVTIAVASSGIPQSGTPILTYTVAAPVDIPASFAGSAV